MKTRNVETCKEVYDNDCKSPANMEPLDPCRSMCFACGEHVCTSPGCSRVRTYLGYGRKRLCRTCAEMNGLGWER